MKSFIAHYPKPQSGLSLIELMVALLISAILLLGVLELFGSGSQTQRSANALARLQENGRLAMSLIAREARRSGFNGCDNEPGSSASVTFANGGGIVADFPNESLAGSSDSHLTFRYFSSGDGMTKNDSDYCDRSGLSGRFTRFFNCNSNLCLQSTETGGSYQLLLNHANIKSIRYILPCTNNPQRTCSRKANELPKKNGVASFADVKKLQVELELCTDTLSESSSTYCNNNTTAIKRTFSSLIELRNRL